MLRPVLLLSLVSLSLGLECEEAVAGTGCGFPVCLGTAGASGGKAVWSCGAAEAVLARVPGFGSLALAPLPLVLAEEKPPTLLSLTLPGNEAEWRGLVKVVVPSLSSLANGTLCASRLTGVAFCASGCCRESGAGGCGECPTWAEEAGVCRGRVVGWPCNAPRVFRLQPQDLVPQLRAASLAEGQARTPGEHVSLLMDSVVFAVCLFFLLRILARAR